MARHLRVQPVWSVAHSGRIRRRIRGRPSFAFGSSTADSTEAVSATVIISMRGTITSRAVVSRSSKTPTCFYLANRGIKAANVPLVPNLPEPPGLETVECPVVGLTLDPEALIEIRRHRLRLIAAGNAAAIARQNSTEYIDDEAVKAELLWARRLCNRRGWPVIDVTRRSIEETAATVLQLMDGWHERRRKDTVVAKS